MTAKIDHGSIVSLINNGKRITAACLSTGPFNQNREMMIVAPILANAVNKPYRVSLDDRTLTQGILLVDDIRVIDPMARKIEFIEMLPIDILHDALYRIYLSLSTHEMHFLNKFNGLNQASIALLDLPYSMGHEQRHPRPVLICSNKMFNIRERKVVIMPITRTQRRNVHHIPLDQRTKTEGFIMADQIRTLIIPSAKIDVFETVPQDILEDALYMLFVILGMSMKK